ncbi:efflux RND transporter periplasmic adaptor subunit [Paenibacillus sp. J2TS4]|uniref:efflux RND transporter periplasmic adaptor subunit n=1 Tax=Paenibacillus sp. J2TS4 TaxID=2807194 RepID=UPI001B26F297|nr:efflux RND transporter periplasmic adaptor subunit [Paenibacillus sp. J2TS4]GIP32113.1 hypothetical protein J2TS4_13230 [Paenibacillus sp. J2TS4]
MRKWVFACVGLVLLSAGGYYGYQSFFTKEKVFAAPLQTATVTRGDLSVKVSGSGTVSVVNSKAVKANEAGKLMPLLIKEGDMIEKGQLIASYEPPDVDDNISKLDTEYQKQELQLEQLKKKFLEAGSDGGREDAALEIEKLNLEMQSNRESVAELEKQKQDVITITAPISGKVTAIDISTDGQRVQEGTAICTITDYNHLQTVIQVDELDIPKVKTGQPATIHLDALEELQLEGEVVKIADEGSPSNGVSLFNVTIAFPAQEGVRVGMTTSADIMVESKENVLLIPIEAVQERGGQTFVMVSNEEGEAGEGPDGSSFPAAGQRPDGSSLPAGGERPNGTSFPGAPSAAGDSEGAGGADTGNTDNSRIERGNEPRPERGAGQGMGQGTGQGAPRSGQRMPGNAGGSAGQGNSGTMRIVTIGSANDTYIEIVDGLQENEKVILPAVMSSSMEQMRMPGNMGGFGGFGGGIGGGTRVPAGTGGPNGGGGFSR